ncbi:MAG: hypothetical protein ACREDK_07225 [Thermoplasmata archaeon]
MPAVPLLALPLVIPVGARPFIAIVIALGYVRVAVVPRRFDPATDGGSRASRRFPGGRCRSYGRSGLHGPDARSRWARPIMGTEPVGGRPSPPGTYAHGGFTYVSESR